MLNMLPKEDEEANFMYLRTHIYQVGVHSFQICFHGQRIQLNTLTSVKPWEPSCYFGVTKATLT